MVEIPTMPLSFPSPSFWRRVAAEAAHSIIKAAPRTIFNVYLGQRWPSLHHKIMLKEKRKTACFRVEEAGVRPAFNIKLVDFCDCSFLSFWPNFTHLRVRSDREMLSRFTLCDAEVCIGQFITKVLYCFPLHSLLKKKPS